MVSSRSKRCLWEEALDCIDKKDRKRLDEIPRIKTFKDLAEAVEKERDRCIANGRTIGKKRDGTHIKLRHVAQNIAAAANHILDLGPIFVGLDSSGHVAAPWAVVRLLITGAVSNIQLFEDLGEGLETVSDAMSRLAIVEKLYLVEGVETTKPLREKLLALYSHILTYLAVCIRYYKRSNLGKTVSGLLGLVTQRYSKLKSAIDEDGVNKWIKLAAACLAKKKSDADVSHHKRLKGALYKVQEHSMRIVQDLSVIRDNLDEEKRKQILEWMSTVDHREHHKLVKDKVLSKTCLWLLESDEFFEWKSARTSSVFLLQGSAGTGKTSIASAVIDHLRNDRPRHGTCPVAYFYCSGSKNQPSRRNPDAIMSCILKQLASSSSTTKPVREPVTAEYNGRSTNLLADQKPSRLSASDSGKLCTKLCNVNPAYIIVDALDECDVSKRCDVFHELGNIMEDSGEIVKVFITSRSHVDISTHFPRTRTIHTSITTEKNSKDIFLFIDAEVKRLEQRKLLLNGELPLQLRNKTIKTLRIKAHGMFRWVVLSLEYLRMCEHEDDYRIRLGALPPVLSRQYNAIYKEMVKKGHSRENAPRVVKLVLSLLRARVRQLNSDEVASAVVFRPGWLDSGDRDDKADPAQIMARPLSYLDSFTAGNEADLLEGATSSTTDRDTQSYDPALKKKQIIRLCRSFVILDTGKDAFSFSHPSVREFILGLPDYHKGKTHARLASRCMDELMHEDLKKLSTEAYISKYPFFDYAVSNWERHCKEAIGTRAEDTSFKAVLFKFVFEKPKPLHDSLERRLQTLNSYPSHSPLPELKLAASQLKVMRKEVLHFAARINSSAVIDEAKRRSCKNFDVPNTKGQTALFIAASCGHLSAANQLLACGANPLIKSKSERTPLMEAIYCQQHKMALRLMSVAGDDLGTPELLRCIASYADEATTKEFLKLSPPSPNAPASPQKKHAANAPLVDSIKHRNLGAMKALLDDNRVKPKSSATFRALSENKWFRNTNTKSEPTSSKDVFQAFFNHPRVDINSRDGDGNTVLHHAVKQRLGKLVDFLLSHPKTNIHVRDKEGNSPREIADSNGYSEIVKMFELRLKKSKHRG